MKKFRFHLYAVIAALIVTALPVSARGDIYSVETCPGEDASRTMNISWAADTTVTGSKVIYTERKDSGWKHARTAPAVIHRCAVFDSIYSKTPDNKDFYERRVFDKCGATLKGLKRDTEYMYRITGDGAADSNVHYFKTAGDKEWSACVISDFHSYTPLPHRLEDAMNMVSVIQNKDPEIDWVLHLGDVCAWGGSYSFWQRLFEEKYFHDYMWAGVNGNHDNMSRKFELTNEYFRNANHYPLNGYEGEEGVCYFFTYGDVLFIMLNNENMHTDEQLTVAQNWVRKVVAENKARYTVVCEHYQWFYGNNGKTSQYGRWCRLFDELGIDLALSGNNHIYARTGAVYREKETDGSIGTVYVQSSSSDNERGRKLDEWTDNKDIIKMRWTEGPKTVSAMLLDVNPKKMTLTLYDRNGTETDRVEILAKNKKKLLRK